jgi:hypothetical protein
MDELAVAAHKGIHEPDAVDRGAVGRAEIGEAKLVVHEVERHVAARNLRIGEAELADVALAHIGARRLRSVQGHREATVGPVDDLEDEGWQRFRRQLPHGRHDRRQIVGQFPSGVRHSLPLSIPLRWKIRD